MSLLSIWLESLAFDIKITGKCLQSISPRSTCTRCMATCPEKAISFTDFKADIDPSLCSKCGNCIPPCPVQAISGLSPSRKIVNHTLIMDDGPSPDVNELLYYYKKGVRKIAYPEPDEQISASARAANAFLTDMGLDSFELSEMCGLPEQKYSRRELFGKAGFEGKRLAVKAAIPAKWRFNQGDFLPAAMFPGVSFFKITLDTKSCSLCEACFKLCHQKVFLMESGSLLINDKECLGCGLCANVCTRDAITVSNDAGIRAPYSMEVRDCTCTSCGSSFIRWAGQGEDTECPFCKNSRENGFLNPNGI